MKKTITSIAILSLLSPSFSLYAQTTSPKDASFCSSIDQHLSKIAIKKVSQEKSQPQKTKPNTLVGNIDAKKVEVTALRKTISQELGKRATTSDQKYILENFIKNVEEANAKKDLAIKNLLASSTLTTEDKNTKASLFKKANETLEASLQKAKDTAKTSCANGTDDATVKKTLKNDIEEARKAYEKEIASLKNNQEEQKNKELLKKQVDTVLSDYRKTVEEAKVTLKTELRKQATTTAEGKRTQKNTPVSRQAQ